MSAEEADCIRKRLKCFFDLLDAKPDNGMLHIRAAWPISKNKAEVLAYINGFLAATRRKEQK